MSYATDRAFTERYNELIGGWVNEQRARERAKTDGPLRGYCWNCDEKASATLAVVTTVTRSDGEKRRAFYPVCSMRCHHAFSTKLDVTILP
jgi:hypothetical protein